MIAGNPAPQWSRVAAGFVAPQLGWVSLVKDQEVTIDPTETDQLARHLPAIDYAAWLAERLPAAHCSSVSTAFDYTKNITGGLQALELLLDSTRFGRR